jgi:hypothetical protein
MIPVYNLLYSAGASSIISINLHLLLIWLNLRSYPPKICQLNEKVFNVNQLKSILNITKF